MSDPANSSRHSRCRDDRSVASSEHAIGSGSITFERSFAVRSRGRVDRAYRPSDRRSYMYSKAAREVASAAGEEPRMDVGLMVASLIGVVL